MAFDVIPDVFISFHWWNWFDFHFFLLKTELRVPSQNHRMLGVGRDLCGSSPAPLLKQGHLEQSPGHLACHPLHFTPLSLFQSLW